MYSYVIFAIYFSHHYTNVTRPLTKVEGAPPPVMQIKEEDDPTDDPMVKEEDGEEEEEDGGEEGGDDDEEGPSAEEVKTGNEVSHKYTDKPIALHVPTTPTKALLSK